MRDAFPDATLTTDVMVGFNNESEEDFKQSLKFVKQINFEKVHVFPYSEREGTVASKKGDNVPRAEKERRAAIMIEQTNNQRIAYFNSLIGTTQKVLFEAKTKDGCYQGYTKNYIPVKAMFDTDVIGKELEVTIKAVDDKEDCCLA